MNTQKTINNMVFFYLLKRTANVGILQPIIKRILTNSYRFFFMASAMAMA